MSRIFKYKQMYFKIISFYFLLCFAREQKTALKLFFHYISGRIYWTSRRDRCSTRIFRIPEYSPSPFKTGSTS